MILTTWGRVAIVPTNTVSITTIITPTITFIPQLSTTIAIIRQILWVALVPTNTVIITTVMTHTITFVPQLTTAVAIHTTKSVFL